MENEASVKENFRKLPHEVNELYKRHSLNPEIDSFVENFRPTIKRKKNMNTKVSEYVERFRMLTEVNPDLVLWSDGYFASDANGMVRVVGRNDFDDEKAFVIENTDKISAFLNMFSKEVVVVEMPAESTNFNLLVVDTGQPFAANVSIRVKGGASANVLEWFGTSSKKDSVIGVLNNVEVEAGATCSLTTFHNEGDSTKVIGKNIFTIRENAKLKASFLYAGGSVTKITNTFTDAENGAECEVGEMMFASNKQKYDILSNLIASGRNTKAILESRAVAIDNSLCILKGFAKVGKDAYESKSYVYERGIVLNSGAAIDTLPEMDIENRNVKASHSSATAPINKEKLFYMESRGIDENEAKKLFIDGFFAESIAKLGRIEYKKLAMAIIRNKFEHGTSDGFTPTTKDIWTGEISGAGNVLDESPDITPYKYSARI